MSLLLVLVSMIDGWMDGVAENINNLIYIIQLNTNIISDSDHFFPAVAYGFY